MQGQFPRLIARATTENRIPTPLASFTTRLQRMSRATPMTLASWRVRGMAVLRILFGLVWAIDAWFKWQPDFTNNFTDYLTGVQDGQPLLARDWIGFWITIVKVDPAFFAHLVALGETAIALGLIFGVFSNLTYVVGVLLSVVIWTTAGGFGGPYKPGSTDIGASIIYSLVFISLFLHTAGRVLSIDSWLTPRLGRFGLLASPQSTEDD